MIIKFNSVDEFIEELKQEYAGLSKPPVLRLTKMWKSTQTAPIQSLLVVATIKSYSQPGDLIKLERYCGQIWRMEQTDAPVHEKAEECQKKIETACEEIGIEVRAGLLQEA